MKPPWLPQLVDASEMPRWQSTAAVCCRVNEVGAESRFGLSRSVVAEGFISSEARTLLSPKKCEGTRVLANLVRVAVMARLYITYVLK
jgi:hypothetical protein